MRFRPDREAAFRCSDSRLDIFRRGNMDMTQTLACRRIEIVHHLARAGSAALAIDVQRNVIKCRSPLHVSLTLPTTEARDLRQRASRLAAGIAIHMLRERTGRTGSFGGQLFGVC